MSISACYTGLTKVEGHCFADKFVVNHPSVGGLRINQPKADDKNRHLRQTRKRY